MEDNKFHYMMLSRLQGDCKYFLGNGCGSVNNLWADSVSEHIAEMKRLYDIVPVKPEWLSMEEIIQYDKDMTAQIEIQEIKKSWGGRNTTVYDRMAVIVCTEYEKDKFFYGVQYWTQESIDKGTSTNTDGTESKFIEQLK